MTAAGVLAGGILEASGLAVAIGIRKPALTQPLSGL